MDLEGFTRRKLKEGVPDAVITKELVSEILNFKKADKTYAEKLAQAVIDEVRLTLSLSGDLFFDNKSGVTMGEFGVGSRGTGDFFTHRKISEVIGNQGACIGVDEMDDAGVVKSGDSYIVCTLDGMHSRLSDFPFLAAFHATRATLRDVYVMGARPVLLFSDIHVADDGDVSKVFDYTAGISCVGELTGVPLVAGSTLRIGGDMVIGERMTGCVGTVGIAQHLTPRRDATPGDVILMTEGAGGGTITTAAIYGGMHEVVEKTLNLTFLNSCKALMEEPFFTGIHAMTDVTNGGLRGDAHELSKTAKCRVVIDDRMVRSLIDEKVLYMLDTFEIDPLGVSIDSLLIIAPDQVIEKVQDLLTRIGVRSEKVGYIEKGPSESILERDGKIIDFSPAFRESAYTPVKKVVDQQKRDFEEMKDRVEKAALQSIEKKNKVINMLKKS